MAVEDSPKESGLGHNPGLALSGMNEDWAAGLTWASEGYGPLRADGKKAGSWEGHFESNFELGWAGRLGWRYRFQPQSRVSHQGDVGWAWEPFGVARGGVWIQQALASNANPDRDFYWQAGIRPLGFMPGLWNRIEVSAQGRFQGDSMWAKLSLPLSRGWVVSGGLDFPRQAYSLGLEFPLTSQGTFFLEGVRREGNTQRRNFAFRNGLERTRAYALPQKSAVLLDLNTSLVFSRSEMLEAGETDLEALLSTLKAIEEDPQIERVLIKLGRLRGGFAAAQELHRALVRLGNSGHEIWAHVEQLSPLNYYIATAAHHIAAPPGAPFAVKGLASEQTFWKGLLDKVGVEAQVLKRGPYKSFPEPFTRKDWTPEARKDLETLLGGLWGNLVSEIALRRGLDSAEAQVKLTSAELSMDSALAWGFVDTLLYADEAKKWVTEGEYPSRSRSYAAAFKQQPGNKEGKRPIPAWKPAPPAPEEFRWGESVMIPIVDLSGEIVMGSGRGTGLFGGQSLGHGSVNALLPEGAGCAGSPDR
jgi:ClpP class serine protease